MNKSKNYLDTLNPIMILMGGLPVDDNHRYDLIGSVERNHVSLVLISLNTDKQQIIIPKCQLDDFVPKFKKYYDEQTTTQGDCRT